MSDTVLNTIIKLRRDNDYNYNQVKDTFIPANGEPILVDTARDGLRVKIGDGVKTYGELEFADSLFINGYLYEGNFYADSGHTQILNGVINRLYINSNGKIYYYNGAQYLLVNGSPTATSTEAGVMILYNTTGQNTDGTMTQKAITDELNDKFEVDINSREEMIIFSNNL